MLLFIGEIRNFSRVFPFIFVYLKFDLETLHWEKIESFS